MPCKYRFSHFFLRALLTLLRRIIMYNKVINLISFILVLMIASSASSDLVLHWSLDEGSGSVANDLSGNGNDGTLNGEPKWGTGKTGGGLECDGTDDFIEVPRIVQDDFTLMAWIKTDTPGLELGAQGYQGSGLIWSDVGGVANDFILAVLGTKLSFFCGNPDLSVNSDKDVVTGQWVHVAAVRNLQDRQISIFIDGEHENTIDHANSNPLNAHDVIAVGGNTLDSRYYTGLIDEVRIYDHALDGAEILGAMQGQVWPYAWGPTPADGDMHFDTWVNIAWNAGGFATSHDIYIGDNLEDVMAGAESTFVGNQTDTFLVAGFPGFPFPDGLVPGTTYYWRIDEVNEAEPNSPWIGEIWSFTIPPKTAYDPIPVDEAEGVSVNAQLSWTPGFGAKLHTVYFGETFEEVDISTGGQAQGTASYSPGELKMARTYFWRVDEFDIVETHKGDVWSFITEGAVSNPSPAKGAVDVTQTPILTWTPGLGSTYDIFFGADASALDKKASGNLGQESYEPGQLEWNTTYYWRIDEANSTNADSPWTGPVWSFTTANFLIIDDMEAYNDLDPAEEGSNRIFNAWLDGFGDPTNGSLVGYDNPPFAEQTIVHSGNQSMPMTYDNSAAAKSEATLTLTTNRDWTANSVDTLTIWFRGEAGNAAEQMYVILNSSTRVDCDIPNAATITSWTAWNIDLQQFADQGVNLVNVDSITLGLSSVTGGTGMMYFDVIRLYPPAQ
jgi:hypothetical protein